MNQSIICVSINLFSFLPTLSISTSYRYFLSILTTRVLLAAKWRGSSSDCCFPTPEAAHSLLCCLLWLSYQDDVYGRPCQTIVDLCSGTRGGVANSACGRETPAPDPAHQRLQQSLELKGSNPWLSVRWENRRQRDYRPGVLPTPGWPLLWY